LRSGVEERRINRHASTPRARVETEPPTSKVR
jgi:hypothetical protein